MGKKIVKKQAEVKCIDNGKSRLFRKSPIHIIIIILLGLVIYSNTFQVPFHFDDKVTIVENYKFRDLGNLWPPSLSGGGSRWFGFLTFALNYKIGGLDVTGYHIVNLLIHISNATLVYFLVILTFKTSYFRNQSAITSKHQSIKNSETLTLGYFDIQKIIALFAAIIFISHPIQTQAVTYISQRFASLATFFYLFSLVMYIKFRSHPAQAEEVKNQNIVERQKAFDLKSVIWYLASVFSVILAMKTKEIAFTLPVIITLYEFMFFDGKVKKRIPYLIPLLLTMLIIPLSLIGIDKPIGDAIGDLRDAAQETEEIPRWSYLFTQFRVIVTYIRLLFFPINQNLDYDYPIYNSFFESSVILSFLIVILIFSLAIYLFYRSKFLTLTSQPLPSNFQLVSFGIFWFFITLSVESSVIPIRDVIFEHRAYLPSVGAVISFSTIVFYFVSLIFSLRITRYMLPLLLIAIVLVLSGATYARNALWQDKLRFLEDIVQKSPGKSRPYINLGTYYADQGRIDEAIKKFQIALRINPDFAEAHYNLGNANYLQKRIDEAVKEYQTAINLNPDFAEAHANLGAAYEEQGNLDEAVKEYNAAIDIKPDFAAARYNLGSLYVKQGHPDKALKEYREVVRLKPDFIEAYYNLGNVYFEQGRLNDAIKEYQTALRLKPDFTDAHYNLGNSYFDLGQMNEALKEYQTVIRLKPDFAEVYNNLGAVYSNIGQMDEALKAYKAALRLKPDYAPARKNLEMLLKEMERKRR